MDGQTEYIHDVEEQGLVEKPSRLTKKQRNWLQCGLNQAGGKLPLFNDQGQRISSRTVASCIKQGWAEPWFDNPIKPEWQVSKLTDLGRQILKSTIS